MNKVFRDYKKSNRHEIVKKFYYDNHVKQTVGFVIDMKMKFSKLNKMKMSIWDAIIKMDQIVDNSDPDLGLPQSVHCFQTAEMIRIKHPDNEWLHVVGLIHDCGKIMMLPDLYNLPDYLVVGDTFPLGCQWSDKIIYANFFCDNPDSQIKKYQEKNGIYNENIGFDNVLMSWGHDEYMYQVCIQNKCALPLEALYIIRYHSFYAQHQENAYDHLASATDLELMKHVKEFQKFDLYSKDENWKNFKITPELESYYQNLISKYFPEICVW